MTPGGSAQRRRQAVSRSSPPHCSPARRPPTPAAHRWTTRVFRAPRTSKYAARLLRVGAADAPLPAPIASDLAGLRTPATDEVGRPIVGLPRYGDAWRADAPDQSAWGRTLNGDPRHRGVAGLGLELGIRLQDDTGRGRAHSGRGARRSAPADRLPRARADSVGRTVASPVADDPRRAAVAARSGTRPVGDTERDDSAS